MYEPTQNRLLKNRATGLGLALLVLCSPLAHAKLYKYQDENGRWHFSDSKPVIPAKKQEATKRAAVSIQNVGSSSSPVFEVTNGLPGPIQLEFKLTKSVNLNAKPKSPIRIVVPAFKTQFVTRLSRIDSSRPWSYKYSINYLFGDPEARHLSGKPYKPPFAEIKDFNVSQAYEGELSHGTHPETRYAADIEMVEGTTIHAARTGVVLEIKYDNLVSGDKNTRTYLMRVLHNDGTIGLYAHLKPGGVKVKVADHVYRGQAIAELGNRKHEGASLPHLHFSVQHNAGMRYESLPFKFITFDGTAQSPKPGLRLRHPP